MNTLNTLVLDTDAADRLLRYKPSDVKCVKIV